MLARPRPRRGSRPSSTCFGFSMWCRRRDLNPRPPAYEADALPLSYAGQNRATDIGANIAWQAIWPFPLHGPQRNNWRNLCHVSRVDGVDVSRTGSPSRPDSRPGSSGACTNGMTGSVGLDDLNGLAPFGGWANSA